MKRISVLLSILLIIQATIAGFAIFMVFFYPSDGDSVPHSLAASPDIAKFEVSSSKVELEKAINQYLHRKVQSDGLSYAVQLNDELVFEGDIRILGRKVKLEVGFQPEVQSNGDLLLKQQYFKVGVLKLPRSLVLEYINRSYSFPEWIILQPSKRQVLLSTTSMQTKSGMTIHIREFDLPSDHLRYEVWLQ